MALEGSNTCVCYYFFLQCFSRSKDFLCELSSRFHGMTTQQTSVAATAARESWCARAATQNYYTAVPAALDVLLALVALAAAALAAAALGGGGANGAGAKGGSDAPSSPS